MIKKKNRWPTDVPHIETRCPQCSGRLRVVKTMHVAAFTLRRCVCKSCKMIVRTREYR